MRPVQIGGHPRNCIPIVLNPIRLAHLDPGDLGNGVPLVRGLERARQQCVLRDGLRSEFGVNAGGAEEQELLDSESVGGVDDVGLDLEIDGDEIRRVGVVGVNAADFSGGEDHESGFLGGEEGLDVGLAGEVELGVGAEDEAGEA